MVSFFLEAITHDKCTKVIDAAINHAIYEAIEMLILSSLRKKLCFGKYVGNRPCKQISSLWAP